MATSQHNPLEELYRRPGVHQIAVSLFIEETGKLATLLSIQQPLRYRGMGVLEFLRSLKGKRPNSWSVVGQRDFNGDGFSDILWRNSNGDMAIWLMSGLQTSSAPDRWKAGQPENSAATTRHGPT